jgi:hypothetical protein
MKLEHHIIGLLLLVAVYLFIHRVPKNGVDVKYITKYEQRIDTLIKDTTIFKTKIRRFKDTIIVYRDSIIVAKENNDTVKIIAFQDSVIEQQDYTIKWQDTLIGQLDTIVMLQNKVNDKLKDSIIDLQQNKKRKKLAHILSAIGLTALFIVK